ncbi:hypothetical protein ANTRET_LOCUS3765 [Anthophora retusa]
MYPSIEETWFQILLVIFQKKKFLKRVGCLGRRNTFPIRRELARCGGISFPRRVARKTKYRTRLIVEKELRVALSTLLPRFDKLCANKQQQIKF